MNALVCVCVCVLRYKCRFYMNSEFSETIIRVHLLRMQKVSVYIK